MRSLALFVFLGVIVLLLSPAGQVNSQDKGQIILKKACGYFQFLPKKSPLFPANSVNLLKGPGKDGNYLLIFSGIITDSTTVSITNNDRATLQDLNWKKVEIRAEIEEWGASDSLKIIIRGIQIKVLSNGLPPW